ncbi:helix-turn-helix domain-containing protein [Stackebrandtia albiflava]|nr:helix-turn-helix transcriptional regulator [Stackebrandtia albiflava]
MTDGDMNTAGGATTVLYPSEPAEQPRPCRAPVTLWRLQQLRKTHGLTQRGVAKGMRVSQPRVHEIEHGDIGRTGVDVLRAYVSALGGELELVAHVDGHSYRIG